MPDNSEMREAPLFEFTVAMCVADDPAWYIKILQLRYLEISNSMVIRVCIIYGPN